MARVEAFIAGLGCEEALKRAKRYHDAGADAILVHSKISTSKDIEDFMKQWDNRCPIIIVPTKYYKTPTDDFRNLGISLVIWANHNMRTAIKSMELLSRDIYENQSLINVEDKITKVNEIFEYTNETGLKEDEKKYS